VSDTIQCPSCSGKGESFAFVNTGADSSKHYSGFIACHRCFGSGAVKVQMSDWIRQGRKFREARMAGGLYIGDVAERLGVSSPTVSKAYNGLVDPVPLIEAWAALSADGNGESGDAAK